MTHAPDPARDSGCIPAPVAPMAVLGALPGPVIAIDGGGIIRFVNAAAESFLGAGAATLNGLRLRELIPADSPVFDLIEQARERGASLADYDLLLERPRMRASVVNVQVAPVGDDGGLMVIALQERSIAFRLHRQLRFRGAARSVAAMAAMLAHEVKNPLSGIRGAAQLLEQNANAEDVALTRLICEETDRICGLVDRMDMFSDQRPIRRAAVNIHEVLDHCRRVAATGFGRGIRFRERYDPSLPPALANRDLLIQIFLNLLKNACEACTGADAGTGQGGGEVTLKTAYRHGVRFSGAGGGVLLPLQVAVQDNGPGIPAEIKADLFEPFVTTRRDGDGLGLAFVAKAVADHGGVIEVESAPKRTVFRLSLPVAGAGAGAAA